MIGVNPQVLMAAQELGKDIRCNALIDYAENKVVLDFDAPTKESQAFMPEFLEQFVLALGTQLTSVFSIHGDIKEVNKP